MMNAKSEAPPARWSIESWIGFWSAPSIEIARTRMPLVCAPDIVGYWPRQSPVRGQAGYCQHIIDLLTMIPYARLKLEEHASNGEYVFARWSGFGTGPDGAFEINGVDRMRVRNGIVLENRIISDGAIFEHFARYIADRSRTAA